MDIPLDEIVQQLQRGGYRRLLVLSGESDWVESQLVQFRQQLRGDWLCVSADLPDSILPEKAHLLLGREFTHAIFDARSGLHSEALAMLAGTLKAGSLLVLCTPAQQYWAQKNDTDSLRWNEQLGIIPTPNFVHHLQRTVLSSPDVLLYQQNVGFSYRSLPDSPEWHPPTGEPTVQQQQILHQLLSAQQGVWGIIAARGRGKSTVAGMLINQWQGECWCCAPAKVTIGTLESFAKKALNFWAPDALLKYCQSGQPIDADWLIIDEAATIPTHILRQLITYFPRVLMTTTVDGYEGTGRGFMVKFCDSVDNFTSLELSEPIRFAPHDPLENVINQGLLLCEPTPIPWVDAPVRVYSINQQQLTHNLNQLQGFYGLLTGAHYRTSPLDLRRLLDAQQQHFAIASVQNGQQQAHIGALWMVDEGGLDTSLSWQIWAGQRRPRGNLVAQSLAAHSYFPTAPQLISRRVMRIAVASLYRRKKIGYQLLQQQIEQANADGVDFLSVSFGLTPELLAFWQSAGFHLVRIGSHIEASSGCFTAMAVLPLSAVAGELCNKGQYLLQRDNFWRTDLNEFSLKISADQRLIEEDWLELIGFSDYHRSVSASSAAIQRYLKWLQGQQHALSTSVLSLHFIQGLSIEQIVQTLKLTGQKQWLKQARAEVGQWLAEYQPDQLQALKQKVNAFCL